MAIYNSQSPWADTPANNLYLELLEIRMFQRMFRNKVFNNKAKSIFGTSGTWLYINYF